MKKWQNENNNQIQPNGFLGEITEAKASGLSFTLGLLFYLGLSFIFLIAFAFVENQQIYLYGQYLVWSGTVFAGSKTQPGDCKADAP